jgi:hypothetical protein
MLIGPPEKGQGIGLGLSRQMTGEKKKRKE